MYYLNNNLIEDHVYSIRKVVSRLLTTNKQTQNS